MTRCRHLPRRRPTAGDLLRALPPRPNSQDVWNHAAEVLALSPGERRHLRQHLLPAVMASDEYAAVWRLLGGRVEPNDGRLHLVPQVVERAAHYADPLARGEPLPWLAARWALADARQDGCAPDELREAAGILAGMTGADVAELLPATRRAEPQAQVASRDGWVMYRAR